MAAPGAGVSVLLLQLLFNGLQLGAIYALTAVGFALIFGSTKVFHVAHGASFTLAGYLFWWSINSQKWHWTVGILLAVAVVVAFGLFMERFIYRPIQRHEGAIDEGHLAQAVGPAIPRRLHEHQVADRQTLALPGPDHVGGFKFALATLGQTHMGRTTAHTVDHRRPPGPALRRRGL